MPDEPDREYLLRLVPLPSDVPAPARLKLLLKLLYRCYRFRCVGCEEVVKPPPPVRKEQAQ